jgi:hypothetical protein
MSTVIRGALTPASWSGRVCTAWDGRTPRRHVYRAVYLRHDRLLHRCSPHSAGRGQLPHPTCRVDPSIPRPPRGLLQLRPCALVHDEGAACGCVRRRPPPFDRTSFGTQRSCHTHARSVGEPGSPAVTTGHAVVPDVRTPSERAVTYGSHRGANLDPSPPSARHESLSDLWSWLLQVRALPPEPPTGTQVASAGPAVPGEVCDQRVRGLTLPRSLTSCCPASSLRSCRKRGRSDGR